MTGWEIVVALTGVAVAALALGLDRLLGEPPRWHPLVGFGRVAARIEVTFNRPTRPARQGRVYGALAVAACVGGPTALVFALLAWLPGSPLVEVLVLYFTLGRRSLREHARAVQAPLEAGDLPGARLAVARMVSRQCDALDAPGVAGAATESVLENGADAIFSALFWFALAGAPGALAYRLANTLDAMWGYRSARFEHFGWAAARLDDALNLIPARLTALGYAWCGSTAAALRCWRAQAWRWKSPNAGPVMAAGAGALQVTLGGPARYHGRLEQRPALGCGAPAQAGDIARALALLDRTLVLWLAVWAGMALAQALGLAALGNRP